MSHKIYYNLKKVFNSQKTVGEYFKEEFSDLDYKHTASLSALVFVEDKINANKLKTYSDIVAKLNLDDFAFAIVCLYEMYQDNDIPLSFQEKKNIVLSITKVLIDNNSPDFDEYHRRLTHAISGAYQRDQYWGEEPPLYGWGNKDSTQILLERSKQV